MTKKYDDLYYNNDPDRNLPIHNKKDRKYFEELSNIIKNRPINPFADVLEFANTFKGGNTPKEELGFPEPDILKFRERFIEEEGVTEFRAANAAGNFPEAIDGLLDVTWVALGALMCYGVTEECFKDLWQELVRSNTHAKLWEDGKPRFTPDGLKVIKPPGYKPADFKSILIKHGYKNDNESGN